MNFKEHVATGSQLPQAVAPVDLGLPLLDARPQYQFSVSNLYFIMLAITFSYVKYADYSKNVFSLIVLLLFWLLRECYLMIPIGIIGSIQVYILLCKYYFYFF